jgi:hypothetical protein
MKESKGKPKTKALKTNASQPSLKGLTAPPPKPGSKGKPA